MIDITLNDLTVQQRYNHKVPDQTCELVISSYASLRNIVTRARQQLTSSGLLKTLYTNYRQWVFLSEDYNGAEWHSVCHCITGT